MSTKFSSRPPHRVSGAGRQNATHFPRLGKFGGAILTLMVAIGLLWVPSLHAQTTAQVSGTVTDSSGGVIPGATVTLINQATNTKRVTVTNGVGLYTFPSIAPSTYTIEATAKGFRAKQLTGIVVHAGNSLSIPALALAVGAATQTVQVEAAPQIIPTDNGAREDILDSKQIENLALEGQDATELLKVLPGATTQSGGLTQASPSFSDLNVSANESAIGSGININGVPNRGGTELLADGVDVLDPGDEAGSISMINPQMTQEITVQTSNFGAESQYGPVVVSAISKSGGDHYHGEAYFDARNDVLNANDWQDNHQGIKKGDAHYYYPGGDFGGPVPGTHKTLFFWGGYERFLQNQGNANVLKSYIPSPEMMQGNFTTDNADNQELCPNGFYPNPTGKSLAQGAWCNDLSGTALPNGTILPSVGGSGSTVADNGQDIPSQFLDPGAKALSSFWPKANANPATTPGGYNYYQPIDNINNGWIYRFRVDWDPTEATKIYVSYQQAFSSELAQGNGAHIYWTPGNSVPMPGGGLYGSVYTKALAGHFIHIFSPTATNAFVAAWGYGNFPFAPPNISAMYKTTLGYPSSYGTVFGSGSKFIPSYSTAGNFTFPDFSQSDIFEPHGYYLVRKEVPSFSDTFTKVWGAQTIKFGAYTQNTGNLQGNDGTNLNGDITSFSGQNPDVLTGKELGSNNPVANFIMGVATGYQESNAAPVSDMAYQATAAFADDAWRVNSKLNLEFGARFEHVGHWYDRQGTGMAVFFPDRVRSDYESGKPAPGYYWHGIDPGIPLSGQPNRLMFVSPRFGLAYDVFGTGKTVIRGGWGAYRFTGQYNDYAGALTTAQGVKNYDLPGQKTVLLSQIGQLGSTIGTCTSQCGSGSQNGLDANDYGEPLTYAYNLTIDQRLPWNSLLDVAYVGNSTSQILDVSESIEGSDFNALADQNKTPIGAFFHNDPVTGNAPSTNPENQQYNADGTPTGNQAADFHPLGYAYGTSTVVEAKSLGYTNYNGLQVAWIKSAGRLTYDFNATWSKTLGTGLQENPYNINQNYGVEAIDRPFVFNSSYTYQTGHFNHGNAFVRGALSGWTISGISTWQAGGSLMALLGNGVPNFGFGNGYDKSTLPANATADHVGTGISTATYYGTDETGLAIMPILTCNPNAGLHKYQRVNGACFKAPALGAPGAMGQFGGQKYPYMSMGSYFDNDLALYKSFPIHEKQTIQFRISAFNWLNHPLPEFSSQNRVSLSYLTNYQTRQITDTTPSTFGYMDTKSQAPFSRILELNVKYSF